MPDKFRAFFSLIRELRLCKFFELIIGVNINTVPKF